MKRVVLDIESSGLLQHGIDYTKLPYRLKDDFQIWCVVCRDVDTNEVVPFVGKAAIRLELKTYLASVDEIIGHNISSFDLMALMLWADISYRIGFFGEADTINGKEVKIWDTLVLSKLLYSAKLQEHSLAAWGKRLGEPKTDYHDWSKFSQEMLDYCIQDTAVNAKLFFKLMEEFDSHSWQLAYRLELKLVDITLRQEHYGFWFNKDLAADCVKELDQLMEDIARRVDPTLPPKILNKGEQKQYIPPKIQFLKNGAPSSHIKKWVEKHSGAVDQSGDYWYASVYEKRFQLPIPQEPIITHGKASIDDIEHLKWYLMSLGWLPTQYRERDLTVGDKKQKRTQEEYEQTVERYVDQTLNGLFCEFRCDTLDISPSKLKTHLLKQKITKPVRVPTSPSLTVGVEKEICPNLAALADKFPFAKDVVQYYTYKHRRNSIAGGVDEDGEPSSGFITAVRNDGRIPTPADTNGANTSRYLHKVVCNIPRVTSLYGDNMRALFGVDRSKDQVQLGFDFSSLEAVCQGHFCLPYTDGASLAEALVASKPNDIHSVNARKMGVDRNTAKSLTYMSMYGAQPPKIAKSMGIPLAQAEKLYASYWEAVPALSELKEKIEKHWEANAKEWIRGLDGRKLYSRSKHSLVNLCFQNAGALMSKYTIVLTAQALEKADLFGDVFVRDIYKEPSVLQMIVMHDEAQYSLHKSLVTYKIFKSEEEAKAAVDESSSAVCHVGDKYYLCYSPVAQMIEASIAKACEMLNFKLPLGFEWQVAGNWRDTH